MPDLSPFETALAAAWTRVPSNFEVLSLAPVTIPSYQMSELLPGIDQIPGHELLAVAKAICAYPDHDSEGAYAAALQNAAGSLGLTLEHVTTLATRALVEIKRYPFHEPIPVYLTCLGQGWRAKAEQLY